MLLTKVSKARLGTIRSGLGPGSEGLNYPEDSSVATYPGSQHWQQVGGLINII